LLSSVSSIDIGSSVPSTFSILFSEERTNWK